MRPLRFFTSLALLASSVSTANAQWTTIGRYSVKTGGPGACNATIRNVIQTSVNEMKDVLSATVGALKMVQLQPLPNGQPRNYWDATQPGVLRVSEALLALFGIKTSTAAEPITQGNSTKLKRITGKLGDPIANWQYNTSS